MSPDRFIGAWGDDSDQLATFRLGLLNQFPLRFVDKAFLMTAGLPSGAAPHLSFGPKYAQLGSMPGNGIGDDFQIGQNGSGDPVVVTPDGEIRDLNHDDGFVPRYINRDLPTLAQSLLLYRRLIQDTVQAAGPDAFLDGLVPLYLREAWMTSLGSFDPRALEPGSFWAEEVATWVSEGEGRTR
ncbi:hypothetical protein BH10PSE14_BH10PSE14_11110 [soil metagenome]